MTPELHLEVSTLYSQSIYWSDYSDAGHRLSISGHNVPRQPRLFKLYVINLKDCTNIATTKNKSNRHSYFIVLAQILCNCPTQHCDGLSGGPMRRRRFGAGLWWGLKHSPGRLRKGQGRTVSEWTFLLRLSRRSVSPSHTLGQKIQCGLFVDVVLRSDTMLLYYQSLVRSHT